MRFYTCMLCGGLRITNTNMDKKRAYHDVCLKCQYVITEFERLNLKGEIEKTQ